MNIGIVGSRRRDTKEDYWEVLQAFQELYSKGDVIVSGGCPQGGDRFAEIIAKEYDIPIKLYRAEWEKYGRGAGFIRNTDIARESDVLIACVAEDRIGGTEDTIKKFIKFKSEDNLILV